MKTNRYDDSDRFEEIVEYEDDGLNIYYDDRRNHSSRKNKKHNRFAKIAAMGLAAALACGVVLGGAQGIAALRSTEVMAAAGTNEPVKLIRTEAETESDNTDDEASETEMDIDEDGASVRGSLDVSDIAEAALPSIVSITTKSVQEMTNYYSMFGFYGYAPEYEQEVEGAGSGFIVGKNDTELLVVTNYHVVEGANSVSVAFVDNEAYEAKVKGYDADKDLAVVAIQLDDIKTSTLEQIAPIKIGSSDALKVGEQVVAIGNAMGYGQSVTTGIVSAKNRRINEDARGLEQSADDADGTNLIQTDAAINPGNSGGALLNMDGEVVGINSAKLASTEVEGMGYAIAIDDVADIIEKLMNMETRDRLEADEHGVLGIMAGTVTAAESQRYGFPQGAYVQEVNEGSAAEEAGIPQGSVIVAINGIDVSSADELVEYLYYYAPGDDVEITYAIANRGEFEEETVTVTLGEQSKSDSAVLDDGEEDSDSDEETEEEPERSREEIMDDWGPGSFGDFGRFGGWN